MTAPPATVESLCEQLAAAGVAAGRSVLVHSSMRAVGPVDGGVATVLSALRRVVGPAAVVVPTQTANNSTSSPAFQAATRDMTPAEVAGHIARIEGFDPATTPSIGMGILAEQVRRDPAANRSTHPQCSFAALGRGAAELMSVHDLECHLGERSPLGALYEADATVLLLGVGFDTCTAFHLAEYRLPCRSTRDYCCFVQDGDQRVRCDFKGLDLDDSDFNLIGRALEAAPGAAVTRGEVGYALARTVPVRQSVDFAVSWMAHNR